MDRISSDRLGAALRRLAADLVTEKRRVAALQEENRELRAQLEALERIPQKDAKAAKKHDVAKR